MDSILGEEYLSKIMSNEIETEMWDSGNRTAKSYERSLVLFLSFSKDKDDMPISSLIEESDNIMSSYY